MNIGLPVLCFVEMDPYTAEFQHPIRNQDGKVTGTKFGPSFVEVPCCFYAFVCNPGYVWDRHTGFLEVETINSQTFSGNVPVHFIHFKHPVLWNTAREALQLRPQPSNKYQVPGKLHKIQVK